MSKFWQTWLTIWCLAVALFGLILSGAAFEATQAPARLLLTLMSPTGAPGFNGASFDPQARFTIGLVGAVTLGWGLTAGVLIAAAPSLPPAIWVRLTAAIAIWFVIDSTISIATGYWLNAVSNTLITAAYLLPVLRSGVLRNPA
jgi:hypothetical protein